MNKQSEDQVFLRISKILTNLLQTYREKDLTKISEISLNTDIFDDLGIDSLEVLDLIDNVQKEFNISFNSEDMQDKRTVQQIVDFISSVKN